LVIFSESNNVLVRDVSINKSPFWTLHFADCDGVVVSGVKIHTSFLTPNSDGLDITSCKNVQISDCDIRTGDDAIAITGYAYHFELAGYHNIRHISENITITNCNLQSKSSAIRIGFLDQNTVRNIQISNVNITNSNRGIGIFLRDEGSLENISVSNVRIETRLHTGDWWGNGEPIHISAVRGNKDVKLGKIKNVNFRDITMSAESGILVYGSEESIIENVSFENLQFEFKNSKLNSVAGGNIDLRGTNGFHKDLFQQDLPAFFAQFVTGLQLEQFQLDWEKGLPGYYTNAIEVHSSSRVQLKSIDANSNPTHKLNGKSVKLFKVKELKTDIPNLQSTD
jgi:polygalacturonase